MPEQTTEASLLQEANNPNIIDGSSHNHLIKSGQKPNYCFGDHYFIRSYWRVAWPAFLWSIFISLGPIFITVFVIPMLVPNNLFGSSNQFLNNGYSYDNFAYSFIDMLGTVFIMSGFSMVGNMIAKRDLKNLNEIMKDIMYLSLIISIVVTICMTVLSSNFETYIFGAGGETLVSASSFMAWAASSIIFYMLSWFFISSFSCLDMIWVQFFSAFISLIGYLIMSCCYSVCLVSLKESHETLNQYLSNVSMAYGLMYDAWIVIQIIFVFGYCYFPKVHRLRKIGKQWKIVKENNQAYTYFYFLRKLSFKINWNLLGFYFRYSYWLMLDITIWAISDTFSQIQGSSFPVASGSASNVVYHTIILVCAQYSTYLYILFNGFGLITNIFLSMPLGRGENIDAKNNTRWMFWWGFMIGVFLFVLTIIISYPLNMDLIGGTKDSSQVFTYQTSEVVNKMVNGTNVKQTIYITNSTKYTYHDLWNMAMGMDAIYGGYMFINITFNNIYYFEVSGNSRWVLISDALISAIWAIMTACLVTSHNTLGDNMFSWYFLNKSYVLFKFTIGSIIIFSGRALNSIDRPNWLPQDFRSIKNMFKNKKTPAEVAK